MPTTRTECLFQFALMLEGTKYEEVDGISWKHSRIEQEVEEGIARYLGDLHKVRNREKSLFDAVEYESEAKKTVCSRPRQRREYQAGRKALIRR